MASPACGNESSCSEDDPVDMHERPSSARISPWLGSEYDFVEELTQDYLCPITLELLRDPQQSTCCGHHFSLEAVIKLQRDKKPCPVCKEPNLLTMPDKFYNRKIRVESALPT